MPKAICKKCGQIFWGWALKFRVSFCDCGEELKLKEVKENEI